MFHWMHLMADTCMTDWFVHFQSSNWLHFLLAVVQLKVHCPVHCFLISAAKSLLWKQLSCLGLGGLVLVLFGVFCFLFCFSGHVYAGEKWSNADFYLLLLIQRFSTVLGFNSRIFLLSPHFFQPGFIMLLSRSLSLCIMSTAGRITCNLFWKLQKLAEPRMCGSRPSRPSTNLNVKYLKS